MSPHEVFESMSLLAYHEVRIVHGADRQEYGFRLLQDRRPDELAALIADPASREPLFTSFGTSWVPIDERYAITVEFSDTLQRGGNNQHAAIRRLRGFMRTHGFVETEYEEEPFRKGISFAAAADRPSRPPLPPPPTEAEMSSVILPRLILRNPQRPPSEEELQQVEQRLAVRFPVDYRAFLRRYNGGVAGGFVHTPAGDELPVSELAFLSANGGEESAGDLVLSTESLRGGMNFPHRLIPVASTDFQETLYLSAAGEDRGRVYILYDGLESHEWEEPRLTLVADAFLELLRQLRPDCRR